MSQKEDQAKMKCTKTTSKIALKQRRLEISERNLTAKGVAEFHRENNFIEVFHKCDSFIDFSLSGTSMREFFSLSN